MADRAEVSAILRTIVTIAAGETYRRLYDHVAPLNRAWMDRWGWESIVIGSIPEDVKGRYSRPGRSPAWIYYTYKLLIPSMFRGYNLVTFIDSDCAINPAAGYFALAFMLQALLILGHGTARQGWLAEPAQSPRRHIGLAIFGCALLIHPLLGLPPGGSLSQAEVFGMAPDPTGPGNAWHPAICQDEDIV